MRINLAWLLDIKDLESFHLPRESKSPQEYVSIDVNSIKPLNPSQLIELLKKAFTYFPKNATTIDCSRFPALFDLSNEEIVRLLSIPAQITSLTVGVSFFQKKSPQDIQEFLTALPHIKKLTVALAHYDVLLPDELLPVLHGLPKNIISLTLPGQLFNRIYDDCLSISQALPRHLQKLDMFGINLLWTCSIQEITDFFEALPGITWLGLTNLDAVFTNKAVQILRVLPPSLLFLKMVSPSLFLKNPEDLYRFFCAIPKNVATLDLNESKEGILPTVLTTQDLGFIDSIKATPAKDTPENGISTLILSSLPLPPATPSPTFLSCAFPNLVELREENERGEIKRSIHSQHSTQEALEFRALGFNAPTLRSLCAYTMFHKTKDLPEPVKGDSPVASYV